MRHYTAISTSLLDTGALTVWPTSLPFAVELMVRHDRQNRLEHNRTEQNGTEQNRTEQNRTGENGTEQNRTEAHGETAPTNRTET